MKRILLALAMVGLMGTVARAAAVTRDINLPPVTTNIGCDDSVQTGWIWSSEFTLPATESELGYLVSAYLMDTVASAAAVDSIVVVLFRRTQGIPDSTSLNSGLALTTYNNWTKVYGFGGLTYATTFPLQKHIPQDSLRVYKMFPGLYRWCVYGGDGTALHYIKPLKLRCTIETAEIH